MTKIILYLHADEAMALAQMCKRFTHDDAVRFANPHDRGRERDAIMASASRVSFGVLLSSAVVRVILPRGWIVSKLPALPLSP